MHKKQKKTNDQESISAFIICFNEEDRIKDAILGVKKITSEIIVVDSGSNDNTVKIATSMGAKVFHNDWPGYGKQKKHAQDLCQNDWVLNIDADEFVSQELNKEIHALFASGKPKNDAYRLKISDVIPGESLPRLFSYSYNPIRLYRKSVGSFSESSVHDRVVIKSDTAVGQLKEKIFHHSIRNIGSELSKFNGYTDAQVKDMIIRGKKVPSWRIFVEFPTAFLKAYILRRYFTNGRYGFLMAMNYAIFRYLRIAKYHEAKILRKKSLLPNLKAQLNQTDDTDANRDSSE